MRRLQKFKKVSWASDISLRQEKLFLSEDPPSQVGQRPQNQLQAKKKANGFHSYNHFPYRLQVAQQPSSQMNYKRTATGGLLPKSKWQCPPTFMLKPNWLNVAGEESKERQVQNQREMSVLEAFYPHPSAIPPNPSVSTEVKVSYYDDHLTPIIRITPIEDDEEEEEEVVNPSSHFEEEPVNIPISLKPSILTQSERNLVDLASSSTFNSLMTTFAKQNLIDYDLLREILRNPEMLETLITNFGKPSSEFESAPKPSSPPTIKFSTPPHSSCLAPANINGKELGTTSSVAPVTNVVAPASILNTPLHGFSHVSSPMVKAPSPPSLAATVTKNIVAPLSNPNVPPPPPPLHGFSHISTTPVVVKASSPIPPLKDINYYKSLIKQHGKETPKGHVPNLRRFGKNKRKHPNLTVEPKPVMNSNQRKPRGGSFWKGGSNYAAAAAAAAAYQPDIPFEQRFSSTTILPQVHCAKRMKLNQEILGRTL